MKRAWTDAPKPEIESFSSHYIFVTLCMYLLDPLPFLFL